MPDLLEFRNLKIEATSYPPGEPPRDVVLVDGVSVTLQKGKVLGLIGESGAGKSTIGLSAMAFGRGGVRLTGGEIVLNGRDIRAADARALRALRGREVTYVAQSAAASFNPAIRLMDQVIETILSHGLMGRAEAEARAIIAQAHAEIAAEQRKADRKMAKLRTEREVVGNYVDHLRSIVEASQQAISNL